MKHPLSGLNLEAYCSVKLGELHLFTINTSRMNIGVFLLVCLRFFLTGWQLRKRNLIVQSPRTTTTTKFLDQSYLITYRLLDKLHLASRFIEWQYSWLEAGIVDHFPLLNFLVKSKRMVVIHQNSLGKCTANTWHLSPMVRNVICLLWS